MSDTSSAKTWISVPDPEEDFSANPVELFFDLAFVFAFSQLVGWLVHHPDAEGIAKAALLFLMLWLPWSQFAWSANAVSGNARPVQAILLIATAASVPMAASVSTAFGDGGPSFAISLVVIQTMGLAMLVIGYETGSSEFYSAVRYTLPTVATMVLIVVGAFLDEDPRIALWIVSLVVFIAGTVRAGRGNWVIRPGHFAERHGLILIVALGEVIVALAIPVLSGLEEADGIPGDTLAALAAAAVFAALLWWAYFDRPQALFEHRLGDTDPADRGRFARDVYTYLHAPIVAGVILSAAALEEITLHPGDELPQEFRLMFLIGLLLFVGGIEGAVKRVFHIIPPERAVGMLVLALVLLFGGNVSGGVLLTVIDAVILAALVAEGWRLEGARATTAR